MNEIEKKVEKLIRRNAKLSFLRSNRFRALSPERQAYYLDCVEDALFWVEHEKKPHSGDGFKFLAASYGLSKAQEEAVQKGLEGKEREKFLRPHQDLFTMFNPYSGNGRESD